MRIKQMNYNQTKNYNKKIAKKLNEALIALYGPFKALNNKTAPQYHILGFRALNSIPERIGSKKSIPRVSGMPTSARRRASGRVEIQGIPCTHICVRTS